ncbi:MAG: hypothetical protein FWB76_02075 [Oscillospiraceae bacterium]|nr:hypothetical protein [Oscillospiraceae bacterium]
MAIPICRIELGSYAPHLSQLCAGFAMLQQRGMLTVEYAGLKNFRDEGLHRHNFMLEAKFDDGTVLAYDVEDGYAGPQQKELFDTQLGRVARYFRRSYDHRQHNGMRNRMKVRPLGLNFHVSCPGNFFDAERPDAPTARNANDFVSHNSYPFYKALFVTQLLDPDDVPGIEGEALDEIHAQNQQKIDILRACCAEFGERFFGGLEPSDYAQKCAPDLLLSAETCSKDAHLRRLRENYVCIAMQGLHGSNSWLMAECCAAGRALIIQPLRYAPQGNFARAQNYVMFASVEECTRRVRELLRSPSTVHRMEAANAAYYHAHVRPDSLVLQTLREAMPGRFPVVQV